MTGVVAKTVETISQAARSVFTAEQIATADGFLQRRTPVVVLGSLTALAFAAVLTRTIAVAGGLVAVVVVLAWRSAVPLRRLAARSVAVSVISALIVVPQVVLHPGTVLVQVGGLSVTDAGIEYLVLFTMRVWVGVSMLLLVVMTMPFSAVTGALRTLRLPAPLVWILAITYRYLFLFFDELRRLLLARNSRTTGSHSIRGGWRDAHRIVGMFLLRSLDRGERVGRGMRARGGARPPTPYTQSRSFDRGDYALVLLAGSVLICSGWLRWGP